MRRFLIIIILCLYSLSNLKAEIINSIKIQGNNKISTETIKIYGDIQQGEDYNETDLNRIINNLYETDFFEDVKISVSNNILEIIVKEHPIVNQLLIIGEKSNNYKKQIVNIINTKQKRPFIKSNLAKDVEIIKSLYSSAGYNDSKIEIKTKDLANDLIEVLIEISRGEKTKITAVEFVGNYNISSRRLRDVVASEEDKFWKILTKNTNFNKNILDLDTRLLRNYYKSSGFYDVKISSKLAEIKNNKAKILFSIDEGKRYTISKISTNVDDVFDKQLFFSLNKIYKKYIGEYYSPFKIKKILQELDDLIDKNNLQFVEHNVQEQIDGNNINVIINVFEGEKSLVERINVLGNNITNEDVIRGELTVDEGDPFSKLDLEKSLANIKSRGIFKNVKYEVLNGSEKNLKIVNFEVEEQPTGEITAGAGIGSDGGTFAIGIKEKNWLGSGKSISLDLEVDSESLSGMLNYNDPNYDFLGNSINYFIASETNEKPNQGYENSLVSTGIGTTFEQYRNVDVSLGLTASHDDLRTDGSASAALQKQKGTYNDISGNYGFTFDSRDRSFMPTSGSIFRIGQSLPIYADKSFVSNSLIASSYKSINENVISVGKLFLTTINGLGSDDVRLSKRKNISTKRLRGFERGKIGPVDGNDHIGGNYAAALNLEANLPNALPESTNVDVSMFLDFGNVWGVDYDSSIDDSNKIRSSTGVAANWMSPIGPMNFILSQNLSKASSDETQSFSFNLGTTF
tara:strand:+ start:113 stop:2341 length:2229 start_codon:yes stop_codon:yes gene_type:complete